MRYINYCEIQLIFLLILKHYDRTQSYDISYNLYKNVDFFKMDNLVSYIDNTFLKKCLIIFDLCVYMYIKLDKLIY